MIKLMIRCFVLEVGQSAVIHQLIGCADSDSDIGQIENTFFKAFKENQIMQDQMSKFIRTLCHSVPSIRADLHSTTNALNC